MNVSSLSSGSPQPSVWTGASMSASPSQKMSNLFDFADVNGDGTMTAAEFKQAFQTQNPPPNFQSAGADAIWSKLDPNGTGSVSKQDFVSTMTSLMKQLRGGHHHHHHGGESGASAGSSGESTAAQSLAALQSAVPPAASADGSVGSHLNQSA